MGCQLHVPAAFSTGKTLYPFYRRLGGSQRRSGRVRKTSPPPWSDLWSVRFLASCYTDWAIHQLLPCTVEHLRNTGHHECLSELWVQLDEFMFSLFCYRQCDASGVELGAWEASGVLLHKLVGLPARHRQVHPAEHQPLSLHASCIRIWRSHKREQPETLWQVSGHRTRCLTSLTCSPIHILNVGTGRSSTSELWMGVTNIITTSPSSRYFTVDWSVGWAHCQPGPPRPHKSVNSLHRSIFWTYFSCSERGSLCPAEKKREVREDQILILTKHWNL